MPPGPVIQTNTLGLLVYLTMLVSAFWLTYRYGIGRMFAYVYLPGLLFLFNIPAKKIIPGIPFFSTATAIAYGAILALIFKPDELKKLRWNMIDTAMVLLLVPFFLSVLNTDGPYDAYRDTADFAFVTLVPYLFARIALQDADARPRMLKVLCYSAIVIVVLAAYEARLSPNAVPRALIKIGLTRIISQGVLFRFGLARAMATMAQPIDLGNVGVLLGGMILLLTPASGRRWSDPLPLIGVIAAGGMVFGSISLTAWGAVAIALVLYFVFSRPRIGRWLVVPTLLAITLVLVFYTSHALNETLGDKPEDPVGSSHWIRLKIIQDSWAKCMEAGAFGFGSKLDTSNIGVGSVDNAYLLFIMQQGWLTLGAWVLLAYVLAFKGAAALKRAATETERLPVAAAIAGIIAMFVAMYTVFYGFVYGTTLCIVFGFLSAMTQMLRSRHAVPAVSPYMPVMPLNAPPVGGYR